MVGDCFVGELIYGGLEGLQMGTQTISGVSLVCCYSCAITYIWFLICKMMKKN